MKKLPLVILLCFALAILIHYEMNKQFQLTDSGFTQMLYLPSGKYVKYACFGYDTLVADFIYLWSIQYYTDPGFHPRMEYLRHTYDLIADLDPKYLDVYQTGALLMVYDGRDPKAAFALLDKGFERNPTEWILPVDAGFYAIINLRDYKLATKYFEIASTVENAPDAVLHMIAGMKSRTGDKVAAYELWKRIYETADKPSTKQVAYQHMHDLKVDIDLGNLRKAIESYHQQLHRYPVDLTNLVSAGLLNDIPMDPEGDPYQYDSSSGKMKYKPEKVLHRYQ
ncbi:MAG: hypothetical protein C5B54_09975 [Acidobacteria bacterium]|nr:MAG: hypothetical protein C5B54_09975 [Acidobacteriota bacterium]